MAGRTKAGQAPRCQEPLRNGTPCGTAVENGEDKCAFHLANPPEVAEVAAVLPPEPVPVFEPQVLEPEASPADPDEGLLVVEPTRVAPGELRARLAKDLGDGYDQLVGTLADAMEGANASRWIACTECGHKGVYVGPDYRTRLDAAAKWVELGLGRKREDAGSPIGRLDPAGLVNDPLDMDAEERAAMMLSLAAHFPSVFAQAGELLADARAAGLNIGKVLNREAA